MFVCKGQTCGLPAGNKKPMPSLSFYVSKLLLKLFLGLIFVPKLLVDLPSIAVSPCASRSFSVSFQDPPSMKFFFKIKEESRKYLLTRMKTCVDLVALPVTE